MKRTLFSALLLAIVIQFGVSQESPKEKAFQNITEDLIIGPMEFLASDWTMGRETGTKGAYMASDYIASMFKTFGLEPGGDYIRAPRRRSSRNNTQPTKPKRSYFQNFNLLEYRSGDKQSCSIISSTNNSLNETKLIQNLDFTITTGTRAVNIQSELVFVGYGFVGEGYNDFEGIDVENKVIIRLVGFPGHKNKESQQYKKYISGSSNAYAAYYIERGKDIEAIKAGAAAVIEIQANGQSFKAIPDNVPFRYNEKNYEGDEPFRTAPRVRLTIPKSNSTLTKVRLSDDALKMLLNNSDLNIKKFEAQAEKKGKPNSRSLSSKLMKIETEVVSRVIQARNVIGIIEGKNTDACIVVGAHFDHLGQIRNLTFNGADDNASGTVGIMTIAKSIIETGVKPEYTLVFCAWTGEEKGLLGSAYYVKHPLINNIKCYMNYDMISRVELDDPNNNKCDFQYTSTVPQFRDFTERHIKEFDINLDIKYNGSEKPTGGSDFSSFSRAGYPIFLLHGKFTPDYHKHTDHIDKVNLVYMRDIIRLGFLNIFELATNIW
ncbi:MAG: M20/M25/M40 family metallo-hydrolase [Bacteroidales bacterium]|nr:M20/M25/M40 family metallo-hydrolase [Bacteroidales bacterium]